VALIGQTKVAQELGRTSATIKRWREKGIFPEPIVINGRFMWEEEVVDEFKRTNRLGCGVVRAGQTFGDN
jgi:predicted DNA-binding transcriptional regulator AlpA